MSTLFRPSSVNGKIRKPAEMEAQELVLEDTLEDVYLCIFCKKTVGPRQSMTSHVTFNHPKDYGILRRKEICGKSITCDICYNTFTNMQSYLTHHKVVKEVSNQENIDTTDSEKGLDNISIRCLESGCVSAEFDSLRSLRGHLMIMHKLNFKEENVSFNSLQEFLSWKSEIERKTHCAFVLSSETEFEQHRKGVYLCKFHGAEIDRGDVIACTACIDISINSLTDAVIVSAVLTHYGHPTEPRMSKTKKRKLESDEEWKPPSEVALKPAKAKKVSLVKPSVTPPSSSSTAAPVDNLPTDAGLESFNATESLIKFVIESQHLGEPKKTNVLGWAKIAKQLKIKGFNVTWKDCKKKWKELEDTYQNIFQNKIQLNKSHVFYELMDQALNAQPLSEVVSDNEKEQPKTNGESQINGEYHLDTFNSMMDVEIEPEVYSSLVGLPKAEDPIVKNDGPPQWFLDYLKRKSRARDQQEEKWEKELQERKQMHKEIVQLMKENNNTLKKLTNSIIKLLEHETS